MHVNDVQSRFHLRYNGRGPLFQGMLVKWVEQIDHMHAPGQSKGHGIALVQVKLCIWEPRPHAFNVGYGHVTQFSGIFNAYHLSETRFGC